MGNRAYELVETGKTLDLFVSVDKSGLAKANKLSLENMFLDRAKSSQSSTSASPTISFADVEQVSFTSSGVSASTINITLSNLNDNATYYLKITKQANKSVTIVGQPDNALGQTYSGTTLYLKITTIGGGVNVERIDNYRQGSISGIGCSITGGGLDTVNKFNYWIVGNQCFFDLEFDCSGITSEDVIFNFSGFPYTMAAARFPMWAYTSLKNPVTAKLESGVITLSFGSIVGWVTAETFNVGGSFIIK